MNLFAKFIIDTAENEPPKVSMKWRSPSGVAPFILVVGVLEVDGATSFACAGQASACTNVVGKEAKMSCDYHLAGIIKGSTD